MIKTVPQWLKPSSLAAFTARLKAVPFVQSSSEIGSKQAEPYKLTRLDYKTVVAHFASNSLPVKIFQQRNGILSRQPGYLFKAGYVHGLPVKLTYLGAQAGKGFVVHEEIL